MWLKTTKVLKDYFKKRVQRIDTTRKKHVDLIQQGSK